MSANAQKIYHVIGGGTVNHIRSHFALTAVAYGSTARAMHKLFDDKGLNAELHLTKMACAGQSNLETNDDISDLVDQILADPNSAVLIFNPAITDFEGQIGAVPSGKYAERMRSREAKNAQVKLSMADKIVPRIKQQRPDITLVAFKTTTNVGEDVQYQRGMQLLNGAQADFVLANDTGTRLNMVLDKQGTILMKTADREQALEFLADNVHQTAEQKFNKAMRPSAPKSPSLNKDI